ncbi:MAG: hypothetical protein M1813_001538 [Trichoglossum hirsutum]|nr:MAG: hypothetical protein M1813_001538 [Trichoglossum hirsutum]
MTDHLWLANAISRLLGWSYVLCWSASFYPQPWLNWQRKSTVGLAIDFPVVNILGFVSYSISTLAFLSSPLIRYQYAVRNPVSPEPTVRFNDLAFAVHAVLLSCITYSQFWCWGFKTNRAQRISWPIMGIFFGSLLSVVITILIVIAKGGDQTEDALGWAWIDVIYALGYVKLIVTFVKYIPQAWKNYQRQSTVGWSIYQILLDISGGILSLMQLILDSSLQNDWSGISGNPVKFGLSIVSMSFDVLFMIQHYLLYPYNGMGELTPLIREEGFE